MIFNLPAHLGHFAEPLLYIHWFRRFRTTHDSTTGMYQVARSTRNHQPSSEVVSARRVIRGCHLLPRFGSAPVDRSWKSETVVDVETDFLLNHYIDFHLFHDIVSVAEVMGSG